MPSVAPHLILVALLVLAGVLFLASLGRGNGFRAADYRRKRLLTRWELRALAEIKGQLPPGFHACPQVRLADFIEVAVDGDRSRHRSALNRVAAKSVDYVVIDAAGAVALVVELDDRSHDRPERARRDREVNAVLERCGVPLLRVRPGQAVQVRHLLASHALLGVA